MQVGKFKKILWLLKFTKNRPFGCGPGNIQSNKLLIMSVWSSRQIILSLRGYVVVFMTSLLNIALSTVSLPASFNVKKMVTEMPL
jgi:hypothetical protein